MRRGRTLTKHLNLETRQYDLLNIDLGEGAPRKQLGLALFSFIVWIGLLAPFLGFPNRVEALVYLVPPGLFAWAAWQKSPSHNGRRRRLTDWAIGLRYATTGHRPVLSLGARPATRAEMLPLRERLPIDAVIDFLDFRKGPTTAWSKSQPRPVREGLPAADPIEIYHSVRLYDAEQVEEARNRSLRRFPQGARA